MCNGWITIHNSCTCCHPSPDKIHQYNLCIQSEMCTIGKTTHITCMYWEQPSPSNTQLNKRSNPSHCMPDNDCCTTCTYYQYLNTSRPHTCNKYWHRHSSNNRLRPTRMPYKYLCLSLNNTQLHKIHKLLHCCTQNNCLYTVCIVVRRWGNKWRSILCNYLLKCITHSLQHMPRMNCLQLPGSNL